MSLMESIEKDVIRTHPELQFFLEGDGIRQQVMQRILFLYAKLNPGVQYVQVYLHTYIIYPTMS
jgi:hypothetical protein